MYIQKHITIDEHQAGWVSENHINLSRLVQAVLTAQMKEMEGRQNGRDN